MIARRKPAPVVVSFDCTKRESKLAGICAERAHRTATSAGWTYPQKDAHMDLVATHANGCPLDFEKLVAADDFNFAHDVFGIYRHIDRTTGELTRCFRPRCAKPAT